MTAYMKCLANVVFMQGNSPLKKKKNVCVSDLTMEKSILYTLLKIKYEAVRKER